jgi:putative flippase GtrA
MDFFASLSRAVRYYGVASLTGALAVFIGVEGWRVMAWLLSSEGSANPPASVQDVAYISAVLVYALANLVWAYEAVREHGGRRLILASCYVLFVTGALYGLFAVAAQLIPGMAEHDKLAATCLTMSGLLGAYLLFHRRIDR